MHELSIAIAIYNAARSEIESRGGGRLRSLTARIGEFAGVEPTLLLHAWPSVVEGSIDHGAELHIDWHQARQICAVCGPVSERQPGSWLRLCPTCEAPLRVEDASQMDLTRIDFEPSVVTGSGTVVI